jgi:hypothetical protein
MLIDEMNRKVEGDGGQSGSQSKYCGRRDRTCLQWQLLETPSKKIKIHALNVSINSSRDNPLSGHNLWALSPAESSFERRTRRVGDTNSRGICSQRT